MPASTPCGTPTVPKDLLVGVIGKFRLDINAADGTAASGGGRRKASAWGRS
jgi:hypothetical protein